MLRGICYWLCKGFPEARRKPLHFLVIMGKRLWRPSIEKFI